MPVILADCAKTKRIGIDRSEALFYHPKAFLSVFLKFISIGQHQ